MNASLALISAAALFTGGPTTTEAPQFRANISADGHRPVAGTRWRFVVRAADAQARPVKGVMVVRVLMRGRVIDTIGWFRFKGELRRNYRWSPAYRGSSARLQAKIMGPGGARTVGYTVQVRSDWPRKTGRPRFQVALTGAGHVARAGTPWRLAVRAFDSSGRPVGGTAVVRIVVPGRLVDTLGWFGFTGTLRRTHVWPSELRGKSALVEARVLGPGGTRTAAYWVRVR